MFERSQTLAITDPALWDAIQLENPRQEHKPKRIIAGALAYSLHIDFVYGA